MLKKVVIIVGVIAVVAIGVLILLKQQEDKSQNVIKIGAVLPLTGDIASYGTDTKNGIDLAIDLANNKQTKYKFVVEYHDSKGEAKTAVTVLERLLATSKPIVVIGENTSSATASMIPIADKHKTILISPSATASNLSKQSSYFFRVYPSDIEEGIFMANTIAQKHLNANVSIIYVNNDFGIGSKDVFEKNAKVLGIKVLQSFGYSADATDFKSILTIVKSQKPDVIYMPGYYKDGAILLKQIKEMGINVVAYGSGTHEDPELIKISGIASEGFMYPMSMGFNVNSSEPVVTTFINDFNKRFGKGPGIMSALGYDCAKLIIEGALTQGTSVDDIKRYILTTKDIQGAAGLMNFDSNGDVHKPFILKTVKDGKFQEVL